MGDEHRERDAPIITIRGPFAGGPFTLVNATVNRVAYTRCQHPHNCRYSFTNERCADECTHEYTCTSDQYTDTHVYAHGDAGDRAGE